MQCPPALGLHALAGIPVPSVRLVSAPGVRPGVGEVEVYHFGSWKPVADLTATDAGVVCRQLGYDAGAAASGHTFRDPTARPMLTGGGCTGTEREFSSCVKNVTYTWDNSDPTDSGMTVACSKSGGEEDGHFDCMYACAALSLPSLRRLGFLRSLCSKAALF